MSAGFCRRSVALSLRIASIGRRERTFKQSTGIPASRIKDASSPSGPSAITEGRQRSRSSRVTRLTSAFSWLRRYPTQ